MTLQTRTDAEQKAWDRQEYLNHRRWAHNHRTDAASYRAIAANLSPNVERYGPRAAEVCSGHAARYEILAAFCDFQADEHDRWADDLFHNHMDVA